MQNVVLTIRIPSLQRWKDLSAVFGHLFLCHSRMFPELRTELDEFLHRYVFDKSAVLITIFTVIFVDASVCISSQ